MRSWLFAFLFFSTLPNLCAIFSAQSLLGSRRGVASRTTSAVESRKDANARVSGRDCQLSQNRRETYPMNPPALSIPPWKLRPAGIVRRAPQFANMYYERRKDKYFVDGLEEYECIPCSVYSQDISHMNSVRYKLLPPLLLLLRETERIFETREEINE